ncbi:DUF481 domain-containing protein [Cyanobacterium aponinum UTEX 3222]|uniref:DUF481 domain-containing protein n=1 Tax=Cyanobacterium aponinum TaxID=379064 RepID=UPI00309139AD|nr:DUF481 domain-containing protein [Cyanobacterium aponinum UTEX 3222]
MKKSLAYLSLFLSSLLTIINGINVPISATDDLNTISSINNYKDILSMDDSPLKVMILTNLALKYARQSNQKKALKILAKAQQISLQLTDNYQQIVSLTRVAQTYGEISNRENALASLNLAKEKTKQIKDKSLQASLLLNIALEYEKLGKIETANNIYQQSQTIKAQISQPQIEFPFEQTPTKFQIGLLANVNSFRNTTATFGFDVNYEKQWEISDILLNGTAFIGYDSDRTFNKFRPTGLINSVYRHHFDKEWSFFTNALITANQEFFASQNDDDDLSILGNLLFGGGYNLWRGETPSNSVDLQLGLGGIYEYDFFDGEKRRNQLSPALGILLQSRGLKLGNAELNHILAIIPALNDLENYTITSDSNLSIPLSEKWSFTNRLFVRYRNQLIEKDNPKVQFFFSTGVQYTF